MCLAILGGVEKRVAQPELNLSEKVPIVDVFLGEWGEALQNVKQYIETVEKNGDRYTAIIARQYLVWLQVEAQDFSGVRQVLESDHVVVASIPSARRNWLIWAGSAEAGLGNHERALEYLQEARDELEHHPLV